MIDFIILEQMTAFAVIMQKHPGWVGKLLRFEYTEHVSSSWMIGFMIKAFVGVIEIKRF
jgi:hypothetical protein